jgi:hypothetical protein
MIYLQMMTYVRFNNRTPQAAYADSLRAMHQYHTEGSQTRSKASFPNEIGRTEIAVCSIGALILQLLDDRWGEFCLDPIVLSCCKLPRAPDNPDFGVSKGVAGFRLDETTIGDDAKTESRLCNARAKISKLKEQRAVLEGHNVLGCG